MNNKHLSYFLQNSFAAAIGLAVLVGSVIFFFWPQYLAASALGKAVGPLDDVWNMLYFAGGSLTLVGISLISPRLEVGGKMMLGIAFIIQGSAQWAIFGWRAVPGAVVLYAIAAACAARIFVLVRAYRIDREARGASRE